MDRGAHDLTNRKRISVGFFGIARSLDYTIASIESNVLSSARALGNVRVFCHFWAQEWIDNPRSGERGAVPGEIAELLDSDVLIEEEADDPAVRETRALFRSGEDIHRDGYRSLDNLAAQLHSISRVALAMQSWGPDVTLFLRPDLLYHDPFDPLIRSASKGYLSRIFLPDWQHHLGVNDRFAICRGARAAEIWGQRINSVEDFMSEGRPMNGEVFLKWHLHSEGARVSYHPVRASRVRLGGVIKEEDFSSSILLEKERKRLRRRARIRSKASRLVSMPVKRLLRRNSPPADGS